MFGFKLLLTKIIPFTLLLCIVAFGITIIFNIENLTYLKIETYNDHTFYTFDFEHYVANININIIQRAVNSTIDITGFTDVIQEWKMIWQDGYDLGDVTISIVNGFTFLANMVLIVPNIIILIIKLLAGLLLTGLSLIGINIDNQNSIILTSLTQFLDIQAIPPIQTWL